jgi:hypothetical protein
VSVRFSARFLSVLSGVAEPETRAVGSKHGALSFGFTPGPADADIKSFKKARAFEFNIEGEIASGRRSLVTVLFLAVSVGSSIASNAVNNSESDEA